MRDCLFYYLCLSVALLLILFLLDSHQFRRVFLSTRTKRGLVNNHYLDDQSLGLIDNTNDFVISCAHLSKTIKGEKIVKDISFNIKAGEILGLIGPTGAGKSTLFKMLAMMEKRDSGEVVLDGISIDGYCKQYKRAESLDIGFVFQEDTVLWEEKTVDQNLQLVAKFRGLKGEALESRMRILKEILILGELSKKLVKHISGGSKRKLCCAMALLIPPRILFLDEISNGVDPVARKNLYSFLRKLRNTTTLLITHKIDEAEKICDKIGIMVDGELLDLDTPQGLKRRHGSLYMLQVEATI